MKRHFLLILVAFLSPLVGFADVPESSDPIRIILNDWSSQILMARITGRILETMGYEVEYSFSTVDNQWGGMSRGIYHVQVEVWEGTMAEPLSELIGQGTVVDAGRHDIQSREDWWYPAYVEDLVPGLPDWRALRDHYQQFVTAETAPYGRYLAGPWEKPEKARIRALELKFQVVEVENSDALLRELARAEKARQPIVMFNWSPNWTDLVYKGRFVEFPAYEPACETDPGWGVNPDYPWDCGNPVDGWVKKAVWSGMEGRWPRAYRMVRRLSFTNFMMAELALWIDYEKMDMDAALERWMKKYEPLWRRWSS